VTASFALHVAKARAFGVHISFSFAFFDHGIQPLKAQICNYKASPPLIYVCVERREADNEKRNMGLQSE
jgi:hypothetical protein